MSERPIAWTPTQQRLLAVLADGQPHTRAELRAQLHDELGSPSNLWYHVHQIRRRLPPGETIVCEIHRSTIKYRHVRLLTGG